MFIHNKLNWYTTAMCILMVCTSILWADDRGAYRKKSEVRSRGIHVLYKEQNLERKIKTMIDANKHIKYTSELFIIVYRSDVIVIGGVEDPGDIDFITSILHDVSPELKPRMYIHVIRDKYTTVSRSKDKWLQMRARFELLKTIGWKAGQVRVVVYMQTVYIMGSSHENIYDIETTLRPWAKNIVII